MPVDADVHYVPYIFREHALIRLLFAWLKQGRKRLMPLVIRDVHRAFDLTKVVSQFGSNVINPQSNRQSISV